ncbi:MAG: squalene--hopene cyclase [Pseudomonadota bacterium]
MRFQTAPIADTIEPHIATLQTSQTIETQRDALLGLQREDGHFLFDLEADATIPSEYILLRHFVGNVDREREQRMLPYLRGLQNDDGSWPLFHSGAGNISATVKAYWALKLAGEDIDAPHMARARDWVLGQGGAATANVFTRIMLALFGEIPWRGVPVMPVEIMLLPRWFPFHMSKVAYWSRTVIAPLLVLYALKPKAANPTGLTIRELFVTPPEDHRAYNVNPTGTRIGDLFLGLDRVLQFTETRFPKPLRAKAIAAATEFFTERLNGRHGLGAIYPAMANAVMALHVLGRPADDPDLATAWAAIEDLLVDREGETFVQPCVSPVWDTGLAAHAIMEAGESEGDEHRVRDALDWLAARQILDTRGDWAVRRPDVRPGGWAFQYENAHYPDVDDTAVVVLAMHRHDPDRYANAIARGCEWLVGMQSRSGKLAGGWGAFEPENDHLYLNAIPFADHGALLDPPTEDVTARCVGCLAQVDADTYADAISRGIAFLKRMQKPDGSWFGRWGANHIYGTWSVLVALKGAGEDMNAPYVRRAVDWLKSMQRDDGGWGEGLETYEDGREGFAVSSTPSQTAWALLGLMSADGIDAPEVDRGIRYLEDAPRDGARWDEKLFTGTGFPKVFYLKYHGYAAYFPLWALARHRNLVRSNDREVKWGI